MKSKKDPRAEVKRLIYNVLNQIEPNDLWKFISDVQHEYIDGINRDILREQNFIEMGAYSYQKAAARKTVINFKKEKLEHEKIAKLIKEIEAARTKIKKLSSQ